MAEQFQELLSEHWTTIAAVAGGLLLWWLLGKWQVRRGAKNTLADQQKVYGGPHEIREANPQEFRGIDHAWYDRMRDELQRLGLIWAGDVEDVTISQAHPGMRTFLRNFHGDGGNIQAALYDVPALSLTLKFCRLLRLIPRDLRTLDLETEFCDGAFVCTTTAWHVSSAITQPAQIMTAYLPQGTPPDIVLANHRQRLRQYMEMNPQVRPVRASTLLAIRQSQARMQEIKNRHRQSVGWITPGELANIAGVRLGHEAEMMSAEVERMKTAEQQAPQPGAPGYVRQSPPPPPRRFQG